MPETTILRGSVDDGCSEQPQSRFARIIEATTDVIAMMDRFGELSYLNAAGRQVLSLDDDANLAGHWLREIHPEWAYEILVQEGIPAALRNGSWSGETALRSAEGEEYPVLQVVLAHVGRRGEVEFISTICRDISERKCKELERIEWANRYNAAIRASGQVVFDWDTVSGTVTYGDELEQLVGYCGDEMHGGIARLRQLIHPEDLAAFDTRLEVAKLRREPFENSFRITRRDATEAFVRAHGCFFLDRNGQIGRMVGFLTDVTKEKLAERSIQLAKEQLEQRVIERTSELARANIELKNSALRQATVARLGQRALAGQPLAELMLDAVGTVQEMLPADCASVLQYDENESVFKVLAEIGWTVQGCTDGFAGGRLSQSGYTVQVGEPVVSSDLASETRFQCSEPVKSAGLSSGLTVCIKVGEHPLGVLAAFSLKRREYSRDDVSFLQSIANVITAAIDRHAAEQSIRRAIADAETANRAKSEFLSRMSHELRTPLNAILGFTQLLEMEEHTEKQSESITHISRAGRNLLNLINEVLDIARLDAGRIQFNVESIEIAELLREVANLSTAAASKRKIIIRIAESPGDELFASTDRERLKQVLQNLISNGVKYNIDGGSITLAVARMTPSMWRISVTDTGVGISQEKLDRLFVPFERLGTREGGTEGGTGLGLVLCQRLVSGLGGRIGVASTVGLGSTFWVEVPAVDLAPAPARPAIPALPDIEITPASPGKKILQVLYIEDEVMNYALLERFLKPRRDIAIFSATQGNTGIALARERLPDLILLDLNLPDMNGEQVLRALRADPATAGIKVVAVTGEVDSDKRPSLQALGIQETLVKPYKLAAVTDLLDRALAAK